MCRTYLSSAAALVRERCRSRAPVGLERLSSPTSSPCARKHRQRRIVESLSCWRTPTGRVDDRGTETRRSAGGERGDLTERREILGDWRRRRAGGDRWRLFVAAMFFVITRLARWEWCRGRRNQNAVKSRNHARILPLRAKAQRRAHLPDGRRAARTRGAGSEEGSRGLAEACECDAGKRWGLCGK